jgi:hypothetical protein
MADPAEGVRVGIVGDQGAAWVRWTSGSGLVRAPASASLWALQSRAHQE